MKRLLLIVIALAVLSVPAWAQYDSNTVRKVASLPATCTPGTTNAVVYQGVIYHCGPSANQWLKSNPGQLPASTYAGLPTCAAGNDGQLVRVTDANKGTYRCYGAGANWVDITGGVYNADDFGGLSGAVTALGSTKGTIWVGSNQTLGAALTIPVNVTVKFTAGGVLSLGNYNLTMAGTIDAPKHQIFNYNGSGVVRLESSEFVLSRTTVAYPEWWGAIPDDGIDDLSAVQHCIDAFTSEGYGKVILSGLYTLSDSLDFSMSASDYRTFHFGITVEGGDGGQSLLRERYGFEWKGPSTHTAIKAWSRDLRFRNFSVKLASGYFLRSGISFDQPVGSALPVTSNTLQNVAVTTWNNAQLNNIVVATTASSTTITIPPIAGTWTNSGSTLVGVGGAALSDVKSGEYVKVGGTPVRVKYASDNNTLVLNTTAPSIAGGSITHNGQFASTDVNRWVMLGNGGAAGYELPLFAQITGYTSATQATISTPALDTWACVRASISPLGIGLSIGNTALGNNDNHTIEDNTALTDLCVGLYIESTSGQVKQLRIYNTRFGVNGFGIYATTGSFEVRGAAFAQNWIADLGDSYPQEYRMVDGAASEDSSALWKSYGGGTSPDVIQLSNYRFQSDYGETDGRVIVYPRNGTLNLINVSLTTSANPNYTVYCASGNFILNIIGGVFPNTYPVSGVTASSTINLIGVRGFNEAGSLIDIPNIITLHAVAATLSSGSQSLDINAGLVRTITLTGSLTAITATHVPTGNVDLHIIQGGSGSYTITSWGIFKFANGTLPTLSTAIGARDVLSFSCDSSNCYLKSATYNVQ